MSDPAALQEDELGEMCRRERALVNEAFAEAKDRVARWDLPATAG